MARLMLAHFSLYLVLSPALAVTPDKLQAYLCDTRSAAIDFALVSPGATEEMARDIVNRRERREACNQYIGFGIAEDRSIELINGVLIKTTQYLVHFSDGRGDLRGWYAERTFAVDPLPATRRS